MMCDRRIKVKKNGKRSGIAEDYEAKLNFWMNLYRQYMTAM